MNSSNYLTGNYQSHNMLSVETVGNERKGGWPWWHGQDGGFPLFHLRCKFDDQHLNLSQFSPGGVQAPTLSWTLDSEGETVFL